jgi:hypothetical protein
LIGTVEPTKLTDYLHGVYICSQGKTVSSIEDDNILVIDYCSA